MAADMELYWGSGSGPCWSAMIVLEEKGLQGYKSNLISFSKKEHKEGEILKLNPRGQVPTFRHGKIIINESQAICDYLEAAFPGGNKLLPSDPVELSQVLQRKYESNNLRKKIYEDYLSLLFKKSDDQELLATRKEDAVAEIARWEAHLEKSGDGSYLAGKDFTMADVIFYPIFAFLVRMGLKLEPRYPKLNAYYNKVSERASVQASWPPHWKESPNSNPLLAEF